MKDCKVSLHWYLGKVDVIGSSKDNRIDDAIQKIKELLISQNI